MLILNQTLKPAKLFGPRLKIILSKAIWRFGVKPRQFFI